MTPLRLIFDTCTLIGDGNSCMRTLAKIRRRPGHRIVLDHQGGPCRFEMLKHSPSEEGDQLRSTLRYSGPVINQQVHNLFWRVMCNPGSYMVAKHDGEPHGPLRRQIVARLTSVKGLNKWWEKDKMWVSLAQKVHEPTIYSFDKGFQDVKDLLDSRGIAVVDNPPRVQ